MGGKLEAIFTRSPADDSGSSRCDQLGEDLHEAYNGMERLEHSAKILHYAHTLGGLTSLLDKELNELRELRTRIGERIL